MSTYIKCDKWIDYYPRGRYIQPPVVQPKRVYDIAEHEPEPAPAVRRRRGAGVRSVHVPLKLQELAELSRHEKRKGRV